MKEPIVEVSEVTLRRGAATILDQVSWSVFER